jgi:hypothetical protein
LVELIENLFFGGFCFEDRLVARRQRRLAVLRLQGSQPNRHEDESKLHYVQLRILLQEGCVLRRGGVIDDVCDR